MNPSSSDVEIIKDSNLMGKANEKEQHCLQRRSQTQQKKQVRRRLHTTKPYQEKPINMAEARREIVAALKFHRAKRKQASQQQRQNSLIEPEFQMTAPSMPTLDSSTSMRSWPTFNTYPLKAFPYKYVSSPTSFQSALHPPNFSCSYPSAPSLPSSEPINLFVPNSPLGLNLNLHDFEDLETTVNDDNSLSFSFSSSAATTSSSSLSSSSYPCSSTSMLGTKLPLLPPWPVGMSEATSNLTVDSSLSILDEQEIAEIHYIGDQYEMEWNDDLNLLQSDWRNKFLETVDASSQCQEQRIGGGDCVGVSDEISSCPPWTSDQQLLDDLGEEGSFEDACLPCLDIEDIEGMDGGWLL